MKNILYKWEIYHTLKDFSRAGRSHIIDARTRCHLARIIEKGEVNTSVELARASIAHNIARISQMTSYTELHKTELKVIHMMKKPLLTLEHKRKIFEFAQAHRNWTVDQWKEIIFSDETIMIARPSDLHELKWTKPINRMNPKLIIPIIQGGGATLMIWGYISRFGLYDIVSLKQTIDSTSYVKILENNLIPLTIHYFENNSYTFQQDNASVHTAQVVFDFLKRYKVPHLL